jgi:hypothetical protein
MKLARFVLIFLIVSACIDPLKVNNSSFVASIVVDGMITDQPGPYTVKLLKTLPIDDPLDSNPTVTGAIVTITDDGGGSEVLKEINPGVYETSSTKGTVGKTYMLTIVTNENQSYQSSPETLLPVGDFKDLTYEFVEPEEPTTPIPLDTKNGFNIFADATLVPEQQGLVRFRWTGTFEVLTYPSLKTTIVTSKGGEQLTVPDPPACSGYTVSRTGQLQQKGECSCCSCWITQYNEDPLLGDQKFIADNNLPNFKIDFVAANRRYLYDKYYLSVDMMSTSRPVYDFWEKVAEQRLQGGDLFQTPPGLTGGNMTAITPGAIPIIGVFAAASLRTKTITVYPSELPYVMEGIDTIADACNTVYNNSVTTKPAFW